MSRADYCWNPLVIRRDISNGSMNFIHVSYSEQDFIIAELAGYALTAHTQLIT